jgi:hypothetical protein
MPQAREVGWLVWGRFSSCRVSQLGARVCTRLAGTRTGSVLHGDGSWNRSTRARVALVLHWSARGSVDMIGSVG